MGVAFGVVVGGAVLLVLGLAAAVARAGPKVDEQARTFTVEYSWLIKGIGLVTGLGMPLLVIGLMFVVRFRTERDVYAAGGLLLFFGLLGGWLLLESMRVRVVVSEQGVVGYSPWRAVRSFRWDEVKQVYFSQTSNFVIVGPGGKKIKVNVLLTGVRELCLAFKRFLPPEVYAGAVKGFPRVGV
jgi:hypothetical protein